MLLSFLVNIAYMLIFTETNEGVQKILIFLTWSFFGLFLDPLLIGDFSRIVRKPNHTCVFFKILFSRDSISIHEDTHKSFRFEIWSEFMFHKSVIYDLHLQLLLFACDFYILLWHHLHKNWNFFICSTNERLEIALKWNCRYSDDLGSSQSVLMNFSLQKLIKTSMTYNTIQQ